MVNGGTYMSLSGLVVIWLAVISGVHAFLYSKGVPVIRNFLLTIPFLWVLFIWLGPIVYLYLGYYDDFVFDDTADYYGDGKKPSGFMSIGIYFFINLIYWPSLFINAIYTAYKKLWWWFGAYVLLFSKYFYNLTSSIGWL